MKYCEFGCKACGWRMLVLEFPSTEMDEQSRRAVETHERESPTCRHRVMAFTPAS
jgi:hypothetical protein